MAGSPENASLWADADVYVAFDLDAPNPADADTPFDPDHWDLVGLLDGEQGFGQSREEEKTEHYAWGGILVRTSRRNFKYTRTFTALEDNATTRRLAWPGSPAGKLRVPRLERVKVAFETREGAKVRRVISSLYAEIELDGDVNENETSLASQPFLVTIYPNSDLDLMDEQESGGGSS